MGKSEQWGSCCVYSPICGGDSGPELGLSVLSDWWTWAWSPHQGSRNISSYTQAALTGCQSVWREMLPGQTVFFTPADSNPLATSYYYFKVISGHTVFDFGKKESCVFLLLLACESQRVRPRSQHAGLKVPLSEVRASWFTATLCWILQITCCSSDWPRKHRRGSHSRAELSIPYEMLWWSGFNWLVVQTDVLFTLKLNWGGISQWFSYLSTREWNHPGCCCSRLIWLPWPDSLWINLSIA